ncbi:MAG: DUF1499 domain-containing protein [Desulfovermiculus sp.]|nr:DUF1499 domain-containing protein [Desulfovermiculus sp.]
MLRTLIHYGVFLGLLVCILLMLLGYVSRHQSPIGLIEGQLMNCPDRPMCVSSQQDEDHPSWVEPLSFTDPQQQAWERAQNCVNQIGGTIQKVDNGYLWATFRSTVFGFVDDMEVALRPDKERIQVRSASRIGFYDLGKNRSRVEKLRACFQGPGRTSQD